MVKRRKYTREERLTEILWQITVRRSVAEESVCAATGDPSRFVLSEESPSLKIVWLHYADIGDVVEI